MGGLLGSGTWRLAYPCPDTGMLSAPPLRQRVGSLCPFDPQSLSGNQNGQPCRWTSVEPERHLALRRTVLLDTLYNAVPLSADGSAGCRASQ